MCPRALSSSAHDYDTRLIAVRNTVVEVGDAIERLRHSCPSGMRHQPVLTGCSLCMQQLLQLLLCDLTVLTCTHYEQEEDVLLDRVTCRGFGQNGEQSTRAVDRPAQSILSPGMSEAQAEPVPFYKTVKTVSSRQLAHNLCLILALG